MVPTVYQRLINAVHLLTEDLSVAGKESDVTAVWKPFIAEALALPAQHRHGVISLVPHPSSLSFLMNSLQNY
jgi:hypothetical protein